MACRLSASASVFTHTTSSFEMLWWSICASAGSPLQVTVSDRSAIEHEWPGSQLRHVSGELPGRLVPVTRA